MRKPYLAAYERVVSHLGLPPSQLLFVDDRDSNTRAAEAAGIPSITFRGAGELEAALRAHGVEV